MSNLPLQPLVWMTESDTPSAKSPLHYYDIIREYSCGESCFVRYQKVEAGCNIKQATGFSSFDEAKQWAWNHYNEKMQPYVKPDSISAYFDDFTQWALDRKIIQNGGILAQGLKLVSEVGELADNLAKGRDIKDDIGDCMVVLNNLAHMTDTPLIDCLAQAWNDIKDRKGHMNENGVFIKDGDSGITPIKSLACLDGTILGE